MFRRIANGETTVNDVGVVFLYLAISFALGIVVGTLLQIP